MLFWRKPTKTPRRTGGESKPVGSTATLTKEIAGIATDLYAPLQSFLGVQTNNDPLLSSRQPDSHYTYPYGLFEEALDKDAHLSALITQRKAAVLSWDASVVPADDSPEAKLVAGAVETALENIGGSATLGAAEKDSPTAAAGGIPSPSVTIRTGTARVTARAMSDP